MKIKLVGADVREVNGNRTNEMLTGVYTIDFVAEDQDEQLCGDFGAFITDEGKQYIAGFITAEEYFSGTYVNRDGIIEARAFTEHHALPFGKAFIFTINNYEHTLFIEILFTKYFSRMIR